MKVSQSLLPLVRRYISRCSAEVETGNAPDPLQEDRVGFQTVVWAMVSKQVMIVGSGMVRIDDQGRHLRREVGRHWSANPQDHSPPRPKPSRRDVMPSFFLAALKV